MTLVPAFKVQYLPHLLASLERQTVKADAVLLSDDSPGGDFLRALQSDEYTERCRALNLHVVQGPRQGAYANVRQLVAQWTRRSRYVHLLLDDDVAYPEFYERHLAMHEAGDFRLTTSLRWQADETGLPLERARVPVAVLRHGSKRLTVDAAMAFATSVGEGMNWFGEFSNMVLRADLVPFLVQPHLAGVPLIGLEDLGAVLAASVQGPVGLLNENLGFFRTSPQQNTRQVQSQVMKLSTCAWVPLALAGQRLGLLDDNQVRRCVNVIAPMTLARYAADADLRPFWQALAALAGGNAAAAAPLLAAWTRYAAAQVPQAVPPELLEPESLPSDPALQAS
jgi:hypothetical protein